MQEGCIKLEIAREKEKKNGLEIPLRKRGHKEYFRARGLDQGRGGIDNKFGALRESEDL